MEFERDTTVGHPAALVVDTMIERMGEVAEFMQSVDKVETLAVDPREDGSLLVKRRWTGNAKAAPAAIRPFVSAEMLTWIDHAHWYPSQYLVKWEHQNTKVRRTYRVGGTNYFEPHPDNPETETRIRICGDLTVFPEKLPVPLFLGKRLAPKVERFVVRMISPNLLDVARALQVFLDDERGRT